MDKEPIKEKISLLDKIKFMFIRIKNRKYIKKLEENQDKISYKMLEKSMNNLANTMINFGISVDNAKFAIASFANNISEVTNNEKRKS